jgi:hypothetical protein
MTFKSWLEEKKKSETIPAQTTIVSSPLRGANQDYSGVNVKNDNANYTISDEVLPKRKIKEETLDEAPLLPHIGKKMKFNWHTGKKLPDHDAGTKIGTIDKDHDLHHEIDPQGYHVYMARHRETGKINATVSGKRSKAKTFTVDVADSTGKGPKVHKMYHKILQSGHSTTIVGKSHSPGGQKIWQNLSKERGVSVHGWHKNKAVNINARDPEETHVTHDETHALGDPATKDLHKMKLVASLHKRKTFKEHVEQIDETIAGVNTVRTSPITMSTTTKHRSKNTPGSANAMQRAADSRRIQLDKNAQKQTENQKKDRLKQIKQRQKNLNDKN